MSYSMTINLARSSGLAQRAVGRKNLPSATRPLSIVPRVVRASLWRSVIPKAFRNGDNSAAAAAGQSKTPWQDREWNPATFYIVIFLLIGSMSIQMISLRNKFTAFKRRADVRIGLLREVIEKIQNGENVDVEKHLGSGDPEDEAAWGQCEYTGRNGYRKACAAAVLQSLTERPVLEEVENDTGFRTQKQTQAKPTPVVETKFASDPESSQTPPKCSNTDFF